MLLYILWLNGLVLSSCINIPMSFLAYMRYRLKDKEFYNHLKNRSLKDKILFNVKNAVRFLLPIYNIVYPIKLLLSGGPKSVSEKWKEEILTAEKNKGKFGKSVKGFFEKAKSEIKGFKDEFFPSKNKNKSKEKEKNTSVTTTQNKAETKPVVHTVEKKSEPVKIATKKQQTVPDKKEVSGTRVLTPERINFYLDQYRKEYNRLRVEYETLKAKKAPIDELNKVVRNMNALALRSQQLMDLRKGMTQEKTQSGTQMKLRR